MEATGGPRGSGELHPSERPPAPSLTVAAVARRLGVAPPTLRTWDRRYGLGPSAHTAGSHRRYSPADVARLMVMRRLTLEGVPPADAARYALDASGGSDTVPLASITAIGDRRPEVRPPTAVATTLPAEVAGRPRPPEPSVEAEERGAGERPASALDDDGDLFADLEGEDVLDRFADADLQALRRAGLSDLEDVVVGARALDAPWRDEPGEEIETPWLGVLRAGTPEKTGRHGGGRVVALPGGTPATRGLARAAMSLDTHQTSRLLHVALRQDGVVDTWEQLVLPVMQALGQRTGATGDGIDVEHAFSEVLLGVMRDLTVHARPGRIDSPVLLACAEDDYHSIPLHVLAAALGERDVETRMLGTGLPAHALSSAVRRIGPAAVVLYAQMPGADARIVEELRRQRPTPRVVLGGPGWRAETVPDSARTAASLGEAIDEVVAALPG